MIHPKDVGLAFPRKLKEKKAPSPLRSKPKKYVKASVAEEMLQNYAEEACLKHGLDYEHIPQDLYHFLGSQGLTINEEIKSFLIKHFVGMPDLMIEKKLEGSDYMIKLNLELKTDSPQSKLRTTQKRYLKGKNFLVARSKEEIQEAIQELKEYEIEDE